MIELNEAVLRNLFRRLILEQDDISSLLDFTKDMTDEQIHKIAQMGREMGLHCEGDESVKENSDDEEYKSYKNDPRFEGKTTLELVRMLADVRLTYVAVKTFVLMMILFTACGCEIEYFRGKHLPRVIRDYVPAMIEKSKVCEKDYKTGVDVCGYQIDIVFRKHLDKTHSYTVIHGNNMIDTDKHSTLENTYIKIYGLFPEVIEYCPIEQVEYWKKRNEQFAFSDEMNKELQNDPDVKSRYKKPSPKELVQLRNPDHKFVNAPCAKIGWSRSPVVDVTDRRVPDWKKFLKKDGE